MTFGFARKFISRLESFLPIDPPLAIVRNRRDMIRAFDWSFG